MTNESCEQTIELLEAKLVTKSKQLTHQVMINSLTLIMGMVLGLVLARIFRKLRN